MSNNTSPWPAPFPSSVPNPNELSDALKQGMIPLSIFALCSALSTLALLCWITWRLIFRSDYQAFVGYNQYVILIYNLLLADLQQALAFIITLHWLDIGQIDSPSRTCFAQGFLLNMGDVASGFFVFLIALHTWYSVVLGRKVRYGYFTAGILMVWGFAFFLTVIGPATQGSHFYAKTNAWCWISSRYDLWRLYVHYVWVFIVEFGTIIIYAHIFYHLRKRLNSIRAVAGSDPAGPLRTARLSQAARYMVLYPVIYVVLTLPLATGRMVTMAGRTLPISFYCVAGSLLTSCGWLDTLLYTLTRRVFIKPESAVTRDTKPQTTATLKSQASQRRWLKGRVKDGNYYNDEPTPNVDDSNWHLSTFASVTVDMNDFPPSKTGGMNSTIHEISSRSSTPSSDPISQRSDSPIGTPRAYVNAYQPKGSPISRSGTPTNATPPNNTNIPHVGSTETTISSRPREQAANTIHTDNTPSVRLPRGFGILSETKIEVVSVLRDDLIGGNVAGGLSERDRTDKSGSKEKLSSSKEKPDRTKPKQEMREKR